MGDLVADAAGLIDALGLRDASSSSASRSAGSSPRASPPSGPTSCAPPCSATPPPRSAPRRRGTSASPRVRAGGIAAIADGIMERWFTRAFRAERARRTRRLAAHADRARRSTATPAAAPRSRDDRPPRVDRERCACPSLVLVGDADGSTPPDLVRETAEIIPAPASRSSAAPATSPASSSREALAALDRRLPARTRRAMPDRHDAGMKIRRSRARRRPCRPGRGGQDRLRRPFQALITEAAWGPSGRGPTGRKRERSIVTHRAPRRARPRRGGGDARARHRATPGRRPRTSARRCCTSRSTPGCRRPTTPSRSSSRPTRRWGWSHDRSAGSRQGRTANSSSATARCTRRRYTPDYKTSVTRSPRYALLSLQNSLSEVTGAGLRRTTNSARSTTT